MGVRTATGGAHTDQNANQAFVTLRDGNEYTRNREGAFKALERGSATYTELLTRLKDGLQVRNASPRSVRTRVRTPTACSSWRGRAVR